MIKSLPNLYSFLRLHKEEVSAITSNLNRYYYYKEQPKRKYGEDQRDANGEIRIRKLFPPVYSLKVLQQRINCLLQQIKLPDYMYGSVERKSNIMNAKLHAGNKYFLTIDLKEFFTNISHKQVFQMFLDNGFSHGVARILTQLTTHKGSLPQGAPTSPVIANLTFINTGRQLLQYIRDHDIAITTFLDDFSFSSQDCFKQHVPQILNIIKGNGLYINYDKIHYRINKSEITGLIVSKGKLKLIPEMSRKAKTNLHLQAYCKSVYKSNLKV
ncbi:MAG: RNA-directed polymerase [Segetibacter sp.]|nr:RNA-directed polymerase [Segetibacter sp.]